MSTVPLDASAPASPASGLHKDQVALAIIVFACAISAGNVFSYFNDPSAVLVYGTAALWLVTVALFLTTEWSYGLISFFLAIAASIYTGDLTSFSITNLPFMVGWIVALVTILTIRPNRLIRQPMAKGLIIGAGIWLVLVALGSGDTQPLGFGSPQGPDWNTLAFPNLTALGTLALFITAIVVLAFRPAISLGIAALMGISNQVTVTYAALVQNQIPGTPWTYDAQLILTAAAQWIAVAVCAVILLRRTATDVSPAVIPASVSTAPE